MRYTFIISALLFASSVNAQVSNVLHSIEQNNITLRALQHDNEASRLDAASENILSGPSIEYSPFFQGGYKGIATSELVVSEEIEFPTKYKERSKQNQLQANVLEDEYQSVRREILSEAQQTCIDLIKVNQLRKMLTQRLNQSETVLKMFEKRMSAGDANILDLNKVKMECMEVKQALAQTENERTNLLTLLQTLNGGQSLVFDDETYPEWSPIVDYDSFANMAINANADVKKAQSALKASEHATSMSRQSWLPNITMGYRRNTEMREQFNGFIVGASFPLFSTSSKVKASRERQQSAQLQLEDARQQAETELRSIYNKMTGLHSVLDHSDTELLNQTLTLLDKALQNGEISALQYYNEVSGIYSQLQNHVELHCEYAKLMAMLHRDEL